jgi:predicted dehydrogenase
MPLRVNLDLSSNAREGRLPLGAAGLESCRVSFCRRWILAEPVESVVIGAGLRGRDTYGAFALANPESLRVVAVAEPDRERREVFARAHRLPVERSFEDWRALLESPRLARVAIIATPDHHHVAPALAAFDAGYDVLLEKPIAPNVDGCLRVVEAAERSGRMLQIGHCLRYAPFYVRVHEIISSGALGELITLSMAENVVYWHMTHSFVRGKWGNTAGAAPMILAKCCHDLDLMAWFVGRPCLRVGSAGSLRHFRPQKAPEGATERCTDGCPVEPTCVHSALRFYLRDYEIWPWSDVSLETDLEVRRRALETGPYGRCVWRAGNDVVDHQVLTLEFEGGVTATFVMQGFAATPTRTIRATGTQAELRGCFDKGEIEVHRLGEIAPERIVVPFDPFGHGGGDEGLIRHFVDVVRRGARDDVLASGRVTLESHLMGFAAERSRLEGRTVDMAAFRAEVRRPPVTPS